MSLKNIMGDPAETTWPEIADPSAGSTILIALATEPICVTEPVTHISFRVVVLVPKADTDPALTRVNPLAAVEASPVVLVPAESRKSLKPDDASADPVKGS